MSLPDTELSPMQARRLILHAQGLGEAQAFGRGKPGCLRALKQIGYVQIDTISVVQRAHHHVMSSRVPGYRAKHMMDLLGRERKVFEYWSHAAAFLPMEHFRFYLPTMMTFRAKAHPWFQVEESIVESVLERIREEGPLMARDFQHERKRQGWWDWKPAKIALEKLFFDGRLMVTERRGFQKVYDLCERVLPPDLEVDPPTEEELFRFRALHGLLALGVADVRELSYLKHHWKTGLQQALESLVEEGRVQLVSIRRNPRLRYVLADSLQRNLSRRLWKRVRILSPFDNVLIQRQRVQELFDFDYQIECYVPAAKRKYGYYVLPLLWGDLYIGRMDAKADRKKSLLSVHCLHFESKRCSDDRLPAAVAAALLGFMKQNHCDQISLDRIEPGSWAPVIRKEIEKLEQVDRH